MAEFIEILRIANAAVFTFLAGASLVHWKRRGGAAAAWLSASFGVLAFLLLEALVFPHEWQGALKWVQAVIVSTVFLFPYFLHRFTSSFSRPSRAVEILAGALTAGVMVWAIALISLSDLGSRGDRTLAVQAFLIAVLGQWAGLSLYSAVRLWKAGRRQSTPARRRMRLLAVAAVGLSVGIVVVSLGASGSPVRRLLVQALVLTSAVLFFLGFSPPRLLRLSWRRPEEADFQRALADLMAATSVDAVAAHFLPHVTGMVGGRGAALVDEAGGIVGRHGELPEDVGDGDGRRGPSDKPPDIQQDVLRVPMRFGSLVLWASPYSPFFAREELKLLRALASLADLALERVTLGQRANQLAQIVQSSHDAIISKDLNGIITSWNRGAEGVYGYSEREAVGKSITMLAPPDRVDEIPEILRRISQGERIEHFETLRRRADGRVIAVSLSISPVRAADGRILGAAVIARDVTERKRADQTIRDQADLLDLAQDAIIARGADGKIGFWNNGAAEAYGYSKEEALGKSIHELLRTRFPGPLEQIDAELLQKGKWQGELVHTRRDGSDVTVFTRWTLKTEDHRPLQVLEVNTDITEQKAAAHALETAKVEAERANMAKSEFLSRMSHELRTPLNAILGFGQLLEMEELTDEQHQNVEEIVRGGRHLLGLINEVLDIARIEVGKLAVSLEPVPVDEVVGEAVRLIRPLADQRGLTLVPPDPVEDDLHALADNQRLKQVLLNLLSNAVKYNREGGGVRLVCQASADRVRISVVDTGPGIPTDKLDQLFIPFERLELEATGEEGAGLGLPLAKRLAGAMGGTLGVESEVGKGSTFWIEVPRSDNPVPDERLAGEGLVFEGNGGTSPSRTVLYIEDNLSNLKLIQQLLSRRPGITLVTAMQGRLGLDLAREHRPDLILLDLQLPDMRGTEIMTALKADEATRGIPVVVVTADATKGQARKVIDSGARAYLTKPLDIQKLLHVLEEELGQKV